MKLRFFVRFHARFGQNVFISGNTEELGNNDPAKALPMEYMNDEFWHAYVEIKKKDLQKNITYKYLLKDTDAEFLYEQGHGRRVEADRNNLEEVRMVDTFILESDMGNVFYSDVFQKVLLKEKKPKNKNRQAGKFTHIFKVKAPLLKKNEVVCLLGSPERLNNWSENDPVILGKENTWWTVRLNLSGCEFPLAYKYGVCNKKEKRLTRYESGNNRLLFFNDSKKKNTILHDGFARFPMNTWKGAGVAIPVFSLRSKNSFGTGEFSDIILLVDWARASGLKMIQLLPVNDTMSNFDWTDSYPYSSVSAFALHPLYINLARLAGDEFAGHLETIKSKQEKLNERTVMDYEEVIKNKFSLLKKLFAVMGENCFETEDYKLFFNRNRHWLESYAAFCFLRDKFKTSDFEKWETNSTYNRDEIEKLISSKSPAYSDIRFYFFIQYHLHKQLKQAVDYAHKNGIALKGDIPIGISAYSCDVWVSPELFNREWQAGAPPDDFTEAGQNWGFPIYNWEKMKENGFSWWKRRLEQMNNYFDAFRIDHILGFFRIWSIPAHAVQGIMGRFIPCQPVFIHEFGEKGIGFDYQRFCRPFIIDEVLDEIFGDLANTVKEKFLIPNEFGGYDLATEFGTQRQIEKYFATLNESDLAAGAEETGRLKPGLYDLVANVILFEEEEGFAGAAFHFRISMEKTTSFRYLNPHLQEKLSELYKDYFYHRQEHTWFEEAVNKLPELITSTQMLVCGEDLGMVPHCVPDVMQKLGILRLEVQRMPKDPGKEFLHPNDAPYLSVITPSTHDMNTIRGWWEENRERTQHFYNKILGQSGDAPEQCEAWINRAVVLQHLYSPAMWSVFQLQDILGMSESLRREKPDEERINNPANPKHYWQYRMHIPLEELIGQKEFNEELKGYIVNSGRA